MLDARVTVKPAKDSKETHQIRFPKTFAGTEQLITRRSAHNEVLREVDAPDAVKATDEWLPRCVVDAGDHRRHEVGSEPSLVQTGTDQVGQGLRGDVSLLAESVHVDFVAEEIGDGDHVGREARQAQVGGGSVVEDLREVVRDRQGLHAESEIASDCDAVLAHHGHAGAAI